MPDQILRVQSVLTARDHQLLDWLHDHGVLTTAQIANALFPSLDFAQQRLRRLTQLGLVDRFRPFRLEGGTFPFHYVLDHLGAETVAAHRGDPPPRPGLAKANRRRWTAARTMRHRLGVNQFFTDLTGYARTHPDHRLERWWSETRCAKVGAFTTRDSPVALKAMASPVRPDGHGIWRTPVGSRLAFFYEFDTGTEPLSTLLHKTAGYARLTARGGPAWPILIHLHATRREDNLHQALTDAGVRIAVATAVYPQDQAGATDPDTDRWWLHGHPEALPLAELPTDTAHLTDLN